MGRRFYIETPLAWKFWESSNICNRVKAICAFSLDKEDANLQLRNYGYGNDFRKKVINAKGIVFNHPTMEGIPYNEGNTPFIECINTETSLVPSKKWNDAEFWDDSKHWGI